MANPQQSAVLIRAAIRGDSDSLGELCEMFRPVVYGFSWRFLSKFRLESEAEDLTAEVVFGIVRAFHKYDPINGNISAWVRKIALFTALRFLEVNKVLLRQVPLPEEDPDDDADFQVNPMDGLSRECWERDHPEAPVSQSPRLGPKRRASRRLKKRKVVSTPSRKGASLMLTRGEKISRARRRNRFAAEVSP